jgi:23S rRNA-/tRNA-specific pseudouridylate synthase
MMDRSWLFSLEKSGLVQLSEERKFQNLGIFSCFPLFIQPKANNTTYCARFALVNGYKAYGTRVLKTGDELQLLQMEYFEEGELGTEEVSRENESLVKLVDFTNNLLSPTRNPPLSVLYEDDELAVVLKPAGVHSLQWLGTMKKNIFCLDQTLGILLNPPGRLA